MQPVVFALVMASEQGTLQPAATLRTTPVNGATELKARRDWPPNKL